MSVPTKDQVIAGNLWGAYMRGWGHGAVGRAMESGFTNIPHGVRAAIREAYLDGYSAGRHTRNVVSGSVAAQYGHDPSILRDARCGVEGCRLPPEHEGLHKFGNNIP